jgi:tartrate-resistant acid phosphatase type 5
MRWAILLFASMAAADPCGELDKLLELGSGSYAKNILCHALFWRFQRGSGEICFHSAATMDCPTLHPLKVVEAEAEIARLKSGTTMAPKVTTTIRTTVAPSRTTTQTSRSNVELTRTTTERVTTDQATTVTSTDVTETSTEPGPITPRESLWTKPSGPVELPSLSYDAPSLDFVVFGDVGYANELLRTAVGTAKSKLQNTQLTAAIGLGDNFYPVGIVSDVTDKQFKNVFDDILASNFPDIPFHMVLGNHDHLGNIDAQLEYSTIHSQWVMPFNYYRRNFTSETGLTTCMWFLDTDKLSARYSHDFDQLSWLDQTLNDPHCYWKIVVGHHPFYDAGEYHDDKRMIERVLPILHKHGVNLYLSGHEHQTQILMDDYMTFIISGCTAEKRSGRMRSEGHPQLVWADSHKQAFVHLSVSREDIVYTVHEARGRSDAEPLMRGRIQSGHTTTSTEPTIETETTTTATDASSTTEAATTTEITTTSTTSTTSSTTETTTTTEVESGAEAAGDSESEGSDFSDSDDELDVAEENQTTTTEIPPEEDVKEDEEDQLSETSEVTEIRGDADLFTEQAPVV